MKVSLSNIQKKLICVELAEHVPKIRELLHVNQKEFGSMCGISADRLSRIENEHVIMTWSQAMSIFFVCSFNVTTKEYLYVNGIIPKHLLQYIQQLDESIPPLYNVMLRDEVIKAKEESEE